MLHPLDPAVKRINAVHKWCSNIFCEIQERTLMLALFEELVQCDMFDPVPEMQTAASSIL